jgi:hypothetical protein
MVKRYGTVNARFVGGHNEPKWPIRGFLRYGQHGQARLWKVCVGCYSCGARADHVFPVVVTTI